MRDLIAKYILIHGSRQLSSDDVDSIQSVPIWFRQIDKGVSMSKMTTLSDSEIVSTRTLMCFGVVVLGPV